jgi:hypothetical protein
MPTETEQLTLQVILDDQATAGLQRLRQHLQEIGSLSSLSGLERVAQASPDLAPGHVPRWGRKGGGIRCT